MSALTRRELLKRLLGCATTTATVVLAQAVLPASTEASPAPTAEPEARADELADRLPAPPEGTEFATFVNRAFRNGGGGFRNAGFRNGGFVNGAFRNGGFVNGGFRNAAFRNF